MFLTRRAGAEASDFLLIPDEWEQLMINTHSNFSHYREPPNEEHKKSFSGSAQRSTEPSILVHRQVSKLTPENHKQGLKATALCSNNCLWTWRSGKGRPKSH